MLSHKGATAHNFARQKRTWSTPRGSTHIAVQLGQQQIDRSNLISFGKLRQGNQQITSSNKPVYPLIWAALISHGSAQRRHEIQENPPSESARCYTPAQSEHRQRNAALDRSGAVIESEIPASQKADVRRKIKAFANILSPLDRC